MIEYGIPIIIDNGSAYTKAGFAGDDYPKECFPTILAKIFYLPNFFESKPKRYSCGIEALSIIENHTLTYPIEHGIITDLDLMERLWHYTFSEKIKIDPANHQVLLTEPPMNPTKNREKMTEAMFETFHVPGFYIAISALLSLFSSARTTGLIYESGDGVTCTVPVYDGNVMSYAIERINFAGKDVTDYLARILREKGYHFNGVHEKMIVRDIKEKLCYLALDYNEEIVKYKTYYNEEQYELPDGRCLNIGNERIRTGEYIFQSDDSPEEIIYRSVMYMPFISHELLGNIVISGGCTLMTGFVERVKKELRKKVPQAVAVRVCDMPERNFSSWIGGSILGSLGSFQEMFITKEEYDEYGLSVSHRKSF